MLGIKNIIWFFASVFIIFSAIYFSVILRFPQIRMVKMIRYLFEKEDSTGVSSFSTLMLTLGGRIGVGSIAGVAFSIYYGGIGSIFWMWIMAIFGAPTTMAETILGLSFRKKKTFGYVGGPSYYLKYGLNKNTLSKIYAIIILISYIGGFLSIQTNTITTSFKQFININTLIIGLILTFIIAIIIFGGIKSIIKILDKIVPIMTLLYVFLCILVVVKNFSNVSSIFISIIKEAFDIKPFLSGFVPMFVIGLQRGIFSNESGLGTGSISSSTTDSNDFKKQGYIQMFGVYITTLLICTCTAIIVISSDYYKFDFVNINGIEIVQQAFVYHFNNFGNILLFIFIFLFSLSTILTGYYYGLSALTFLTKNIKTNMFKIITLIILLVGCFIKPSILWEIVDILVGIMAIINIYALLKLKDIVKNNTK